MLLFSESIFLSVLGQTRSTGRSPEGGGKNRTKTVLQAGLTLVFVSFLRPVNCNCEIEGGAVI